MLYSVLMYPSIPVLRFLYGRLAAKKWNRNTSGPKRDGALRNVSSGKETPCVCIGKCARRQRDARDIECEWDNNSLHRKMTERDELKNNVYEEITSVCIGKCAKETALFWNLSCEEDATRLGVMWSWLHCASISFTLCSNRCYDMRRLYISCMCTAFRCWC